MEDGDVEGLAQPLLDLEAARGRDVLEVDAAEARRDHLDRAGALCSDDDSLVGAHADLAAATNPRRATGSLQDVLVDADVFIGVSAPGILKPEWIPTMATDPIVFALANPDPEIDPAEADKHAAVVASGRSDYPNQINNVLAFPGVFRGLLDAGADEVTTDMLLRAAQAIADTVSAEEL
ncbi:MAG TPA: malic enzyme-like NAD(P)-binding protein, partial [Nocardioides sp.]